MQSYVGSTRRDYTLVNVTVNDWTKLIETKTLFSNFECWAIKTTESQRRQSFQQWTIHDNQRHLAHAHALTSRHLMTHDNLTPHMRWSSSLHTNKFQINYQFYLLTMQKDWANKKLLPGTSHSRYEQARKCFNWSLKMEKIAKCN